MAAALCDRHIISSLHVQTSINKDCRVVPDGSFVKKTQLRYNLAISHKFITRPFVSNHLFHTHNFPESLAWYGVEPNNLDDFGAAIVLCQGENQEKHAFTEPEMVSLPPDFRPLPACDHPS